MLFFFCSFFLSFDQSFDSICIWQCCRSCRRCRRYLCCDGVVKVGAVWVCFLANVVLIRVGGREIVVERATCSAVYCVPKSITGYIYIHRHTYTYTHMCISQNSMIPCVWVNYSAAHKTLFYRMHGMSSGIWITFERCILLAHISFSTQFNCIKSQVKPYTIYPFTTYYTIYTPKDAALVVLQFGKKYRWLLFVH